MENPEIEDALKKYGINWANFVKEAGIDGEFFCKRAVFLVNDLDVQDKKNLDFIRETAWKLGRPPLKKELPDIRIRNLLQKCGSYRNVLFQIGLEPVEKKRPFPSSAEKQKRDGYQKKHQVDLKDCYYEVLNKDMQYQKDIQSLQEQADWTDVDFLRWGSVVESANRVFRQEKQVILENRESPFECHNSSGDRGKRNVFPYKLDYKDRAWYLYAFCLSRNEEKHCFGCRFVPCQLWQG